MCEAGFARGAGRGTRAEARHGRRARRWRPRARRREISSRARRREISSRASRHDAAARGTRRDGACERRRSSLGAAGGRGGKRRKEEEDNARHRRAVKVVLRHVGTQHVVAAHGADCGLVHERGELGAGEPARRAGDALGRGVIAARARRRPLLLYFRSVKGRDKSLCHTPSPKPMTHMQFTPRAKGPWVRRRAVKFSLGDGERTSSRDAR